MQVIGGTFLVNLDCTLPLSTVVIIVVHPTIIQPLVPSLMMLISARKLGRHVLMQRRRLVEAEEVVETGVVAEVELAVEEIAPHGVMIPRREALLLVLWKLTDFGRCIARNARVTDGMILILPSIMMSRNAMRLRSSYHHTIHGIFIPVKCGARLELGLLLLYLVQARLDLRLLDLKDPFSVALRGWLIVQ
jgi:hypothetical protein